MQLNIKFNVSIRCNKCGARLDAAEEIPSYNYDSIIVVDPHVCGVLTPRAADASLGWEIPEGYDAICSFCHYPFIFNQAKSSGAKEWEKYCCVSCENGTTEHRSRR